MAGLEGWSCSDKGWWSHPTLPDNGGAMPDPPSYLTDANAVLPLLEECGEWSCHKTKRYFQIEIDASTAKFYGWAEAPTFCCAACEAILRANGKWTP